MTPTKEEILGLLEMSYRAQRDTLIEWDIIEWKYYGGGIGNKRPLESLADLSYWLRDRIVSRGDTKKIERFIRAIDEVTGEKRPATWLLLRSQPIEIIVAALLAELDVEEGGGA